MDLGRAGGIKGLLRLTNLLKMLRVINAVREEKMQNRVTAAGAPALAKRLVTSTG